ncbi:MAG: hypothetical protein QM487_07170 [Candidatus Marithrix sp.]
MLNNLLDYCQVSYRKALHFNTNMTAVNLIKLQQDRLHNSCE